MPGTDFFHAVRAAAGLDLPDLDDVLRLVEDATSGWARRGRAG